MDACRQNQARYSSQGPELNSHSGFCLYYWAIRTCIKPAFLEVFLRFSSLYTGAGKAICIMSRGISTVESSLLVSIPPEEGISWLWHLKSKAAVEGTYRKWNSVGCSWGDMNQDAHRILLSSPRITLGIFPSPHKVNYYLEEIYANILCRFCKESDETYAM